MNYKETVEKVISITLGIENGEDTGHNDITGYTTGGVFHLNNRAYRIEKFYSSLNKPCGTMYLVEGIHTIYINGNSSNEENCKEIEYFLNLDNPFKGIFEGLCNDDIIAADSNSVLSELAATRKLLDYINDICKENECNSSMYDMNCKMLTLYKLGMVQGERQARKGIR